MCNRRKINEATRRLQSAVNNTCSWTKKIRILNQAKFGYLNFTYKRVENKRIRINGTVASSTKYLGVNLDVDIFVELHIKK